MIFLVAFALIFAGGGWAAISRAVDRYIICLAMFFLLFAAAMTLNLAFPNTFPKEIPHNYRVVTTACDPMYHHCVD